MKREMWGRKGEPGFYCRPDPSHSGGFGFPLYFPVFDFIIIIIILSNQRFFVQDGEFVSESVSSSVSSSDSSSHYPQALSHALSMLGLPELLLKEEQKLAIRAVFDAVLPGSWIYPQSVDFWIRKMSMNIYGCLWMSMVSFSVCGFFKRATWQHC